MYLTFSKESSFGLDATSQEYTVDLISESIATNMNYNKFREFHSPTPSSRYPSIKTSDGRLSLELTYGNSAWNVLYESLVGQRKTLNDFAFLKSSEKWNIVTGMLAADLNSLDSTFAITEYKPGEFNSVTGIIVGGEYIAVNSIANGVVSVSERASEATVATSHSKYDLVYGLVVSEGNTVDIISRYRDGYCYSLPTSLTIMINRDGSYFKFNGSLFSDYVFNATPGEGEITSSFEMSAINTDIINLASYSSAVDSNKLASVNDINCYSMNSQLDVEKLYFQVSNTLRVAPGKFLDSTGSIIMMSSCSSYGQFSLMEEGVEAFNSYVRDEFKNLSVTVCESKQFTKAFVYVFNNIGYGTMLHTLNSNFFITDSVPYYAYGPDKFFILIQN